MGTNSPLLPKYEKPLLDVKVSGFKMDQFEVSELNIRNNDKNDCCENFSPTKL